MFLIITLASESDIISMMSHLQAPKSTFFWKMHPFERFSRPINSWWTNVPYTFCRLYIGKLFSGGWADVGVVGQEDNRPRTESEGGARWSPRTRGPRAGWRDEWGRGPDSQLFFFIRDAGGSIPFQSCFFFFFDRFDISKKKGSAYLTISATSLPSSRFAWEINSVVPIVPY